MTQFLISPAERPPITNLGRNSDLPEKHGVDILWEGHDGLCGVQRKAYMDLISSVRETRDGGNRLGREIQQMQVLDQAFLVIEGVIPWTSDGMLASDHVQWTMENQMGVELSIQSAGIRILRARNPLETVTVCEYLWKRTQEPRPPISSLLVRGSPPKRWGKLTDEGTAIHVMTGWPDVSRVTAKKLYDKYGRVPCRHDMTVEDLMTIDGIGKKKAEKLLAVVT